MPWGKKHSASLANKRREQLRRAISLLPLETRKMIVLHYFHGLSTEQSANAMAISVEAFENRLQRTLIDLRSSIMRSPRRANSLLRIRVWTLIRIREEMLGDIDEDVQLRREQGWNEKELRRFARWQIRWAIAGWLLERVARAITLIRAGK
jgi:hypothetical protein